MQKMFNIFQEEGEELLENAKLRELFKQVQHPQLQDTVTPPLPSQLKVHFLYCSANLWLIVEFLSLSDPGYPCCCIVHDLPTELSRSQHCLTLTTSGWETL